MQAVSVFSNCAILVLPFSIAFSTPHDSHQV
jgi:hypothetical protein